MTLFETSKMHFALFVTRMVVMGFVRATCSRGGSVCKDWFDRVGMMVYWLTRNVLSVGDFVWAKEGTDSTLKCGACAAANTARQYWLWLRAALNSSDRCGSNVLCS